MMVVVCLVSVVGPIVVFAQAPAQTYELLEPLPNLTDGKLTPQNTVNIQTYLSYMFNLLIAVGGAAAVFMIVLGGFQYMTSDVPGVKTDGMSHVRNALVGLLLILTSWLILRTINPKFVEIPATLVKPLDISSQTDAFSELSSLTSTIYSKFKAELAVNKAEIDKIINDNISRQKEIDEIDNILAFDDSLTEVERLAYEDARATLASEITTANQTKAYAEAVSLMTVADKRCLSVNYSECVANKALIADTYVKYSGQIDPSKLSELQQKGLYLQSDAEIDSAIHGVEAAVSAGVGQWALDKITLGGEAGRVGLIKSNAISQIERAVDTYQNRTNPPPDPELLSKLKASAATAKTTINSIK